MISENTEACTGNCSDCSCDNAPGCPQAVCDKSCDLCKESEPSSSCHCSGQDLTPEPDVQTKNSSVGGEHPAVTAGKRWVDHCLYSAAYAVAALAHQASWDEKSPQDRAEIIDKLLISACGKEPKDFPEGKALRELRDLLIAKVNNDLKAFFPVEAKEEQLSDDNQAVS